MRAIDADALNKILDKIPARSIENEDGQAYVLIRLSTVFEVTKQMPTIEPERKKGKWIEYDNSHCECPFCHEEWSYFDNEVEHFDFCPRCGADMRGEQG